MLAVFRPKYFFGETIKVYGAKMANDKNRPKNKKNINKKPNTKTSSNKSKPKAITDKKQNKPKVITDKSYNKPKAITDKSYNKPKVTKTSSNVSSKPRTKSHSSSTRVMIGVFVVLIIYGLGMFVHLLSNSTIESMNLKSVDITKNDTFKAIIIRDETVYKADSGGYVNLNVNESQKVKKGSLLFNITKESNSNTVEQSKLEEVNEEIFNLQAFREEFSNYKKEIDTIQDNVEVSIDNFSYKNYSDINDLDEYIKNSMDVRNQMIFADQRIVDESKVDTRDLISSRIDENSAKTYAIDGGIVSYFYDDLEEKFTFENMKELTKEQTKMDSKEMQNSFSAVVPGDKIIRVVESNTWYIATYLPAKTANSLTVGSNIDLFFQVETEFKEIPARVNFVLENTQKEALVIFEMRGYMEEFINSRNVDFALKTQTYMNMKVPKTAIMYKEFIKIPANFVRETDKAVVIKQVESSSTTVPINIEGPDSFGNYYYLDKSKNTLLIGEILINPDNAEDTYLIPDYTKVPGVLKVNNGTASFEKVDVNKEIETSDDDDFLYILPSNSLKEHDRILIHVDKVVEGDIVY